MKYKTCPPGDDNDDNDDDDDDDDDNDDNDDDDDDDDVGLRKTITRESPGLESSFWHTVGLQSKKPQNVDGTTAFD